MIGHFQKCLSRTLCAARTPRGRDEVSFRNLLLRSKFFKVFLVGTEREGFNDGTIAREIGRQLVGRSVDRIARDTKEIEYRGAEENSRFPSPRVHSPLSPSSTDRYHFETVGEQRLELEAADSALRFNACGPISSINKVNVGSL